MTAAVPAPVVVLPTAPERERVLADVSRAMEMARWRDHLPAGEPVSLKPNLGWDKLIPGAISAPWVVEGVIRTLQGHVGTIYLVEADQVVLRSEQALAVSGLGRLCATYDVRFVNMSHGPMVPVADRARLVLADVRIPEVLTRTRLVTLPVMKTHNKTTITGALKNQWGCLETLRHHFHLVLADAIADVNALVKPRFVVMDGTVGLEGDGPKSGIPREAGVVLAGADPVGVDATAARFMGFDPHAIEHLVRCAEIGLGVLDPVVEGAAELRASRPFTPATHNAVSWLELVLRRSTMRRLAFHSPLFPVLCWGARRYYDGWDLLIGRRRRRAFFRRSPWAPQWRPSAADRDQPDDTAAA